MSTGNADQLQRKVSKQVLSLCHTRMVMLIQTSLCSSNERGFEKDVYAASRLERIGSFSSKSFSWVSFLLIERKSSILKGEECIWFIYFNFSFFLSSRSLYWKLNSDLLIQSRCLHVSHLETSWEAYSSLLHRAVRRTDRQRGCKMNDRRRRDSWRRERCL